MDKVNTGFIFALAALVLWGFWGFLPKLTVGYIGPKSALVWEVVGSILVGVVVLVMLGFKPETHPRGVLLGILTGIFALLGALAFLYAVRKSNVSVIVALTALYPVVVILLSYFILHENITIKQGVGMVFALIALVLFSG